MGPLLPNPPSPPPLLPQSPYPPHAQSAEPEAGQLSVRAGKAVILTFFPCPIEQQLWSRLKRRHVPKCGSREMRFVLCGSLPSHLAIGDPKKDNKLVRLFTARSQFVFKKGQFGVANVLCT